jgi:hypothetical protein
MDSEQPLLHNAATSTVPWRAPTAMEGEPAPESQRGLRRPDGERREQDHLMRALALEATVQLSLPELLQGSEWVDTGVGAPVTAADVTPDLPEPIDAELWGRRSTDTQAQAYLARPSAFAYTSSGA